MGARGEGGAVSAAELGEFAAAIEARFGHQADARRDDALRAVLAGRMRAVGARGFEEYQGVLRGAAEWEALAPLLTVPETYFFRMPEHFDALVEEALPRLFAERRRAGDPSRSLRMLSAGCATGEEPYTLRMVLSERVPALGNGQVMIDGVDLSAAALDRARDGVYNEWSLRATDAVRRRRWFSAAGKQFRLSAEARVGVTFRQENLLAAPEAGRELYDVIFCRNVLIYFTDAAMRQAIAGLTARLAPGGYLFLGPAESLRGLTREFAVCHARETFFYRRKEGAAAGGNAAAAGATGESWYEAIRSSSERLETLVAGLDSKGLDSKGQDSKGQGVKAPPKAKAVPATFVQLVGKERFADALTLLEKADAPGEQRSLLRASMLTNLGRYPEAESECRRLLEEDELNPGTHYLLGLCREQAGALKEAEERMGAAVFLDPGFAMPHLHRGLMARRRGELAAARAAFARALEALDGETEERLTLFGGGFSRDGLRKLCAGEMARLPAAQAATTDEVRA